MEINMQPVVIHSLSVTALGRRSKTPNRLQASLRQLPQDAFIRGPTKSIDVMPLIKVVIPNFIKRELPNYNAKDIIPDEVLERLGSINPEGIMPLTKNQKLLDELDQAREIRRSLEKKRLSMAQNVDQLSAQADAFACSKLSENERNIVEGTFKYRPTSKMYKQLSSISSILQSKRLVKQGGKAGGILKQSNPSLPVKRLLQQGQLFPYKRKLSRKKSLLLSRHSTANCVTIPLELARKVIKLGTIGNPPSVRSLLLRNKRKCDNVKPISQSCKSVAIPIRKAAIAVPALPAHVGNHRPSSIASSRASNGMTERYTVGGFKQFCNAADSLCEAFAVGTGGEELSRYQRYFSDHSRTKPVELQHEVVKTHIEQTDKHVKELGVQLKKLKRELEERCKVVFRWLEK